MTWGTIDMPEEHESGRPANGDWRPGSGDGGWGGSGGGAGRGGGVAFGFSFDRGGESDDGSDDEDGYGSEDTGPDRRFGRYDDGDDEPPPAPRSRRAKRIAIWTGAVAGLGALAFAAVTVLTGGSNSLGNTDSGAPPAPVGFKPSATDTADAAQQTAQAFLDAWQSADLQKAASLTDSPGAALQALTTYRTDLDLSKLVLTAGTGRPTGAVPFDVAATVSASGSGAVITGTWSYTSQLTAYSAGGAWLVQWQSAIMAPNLTSSTHLVALPDPATGNQVTDSGSTPLSSYSDPGLKTIATKLAAMPATGTGSPGLEVGIVGAGGGPGSATDTAVVTKPAPGTLATTITASAENAAESAVQQNQGSSMVVIQPSTGKILAVANNDQANDDALTARIAPGSTMKVVTSTALLNGGLTPDSPVECPAQFTVTGVTFQNSQGESRPAGTQFIDDFAASCNNAFTEQYQQLSGGALEKTAQTYFGLNEPWDIGLGQPTPYFTMPSDAEDSELASEAFGQGTLGASPLAMASVAATVDAGVFHQPILLPGTTQVSATPLPQSTDQGLQQMMRAVVTYSDGTAAGDGFGSDVYAKTGTADHGAPGSSPNSWMIAYDPGEDIAIGCVVLNGNYGSQSAGPEAASVLNALG
ncbi:MAG TPA: penicillin-binding transpeptidase domain-containing protein [Actinocrinis sp.]|jgi:hypothetical protein